MVTTVHVLRPESVTPIQLYLDRVRRGAASPVEFACVLLYREREYRTMYASSWRPDHLPAAGSDTPFAPYGLTREAANAIAGEIRSIWGTGEAAAAAPPDDLFGLKEEALRRLRDALRPRKTDALAHLLAARLARDLCRYEEAIALARTEAARADPIAARATERNAALLAPAGSSIDRMSIADRAEREARELLAKQRKWRRDWDNRALERFDEQIRRRAIRARVVVEGARFKRHLATDAIFCERERRDALKGFDRGVVPVDLRRLIPIAKRFGVGDDVCRGLFVRKATRAERTAVMKSVDAVAARIDRWLKELEGPPYGREAAAFFWLLEAVEDMKGSG